MKSVLFIFTLNNTSILCTYILDVFQDDDGASDTISIAQGDDNDDPFAGPSSSAAASAGGRGSVQSIQGQSKLGKHKKR